MSGLLRSGKRERNAENARRLRLTNVIRQERRAEALAYGKMDSVGRPQPQLKPPDHYCGGINVVRRDLDYVCAAGNPFVERRQKIGGLAQ